MIKPVQVYRKLNSLPLFTLVDYWLGQRVSTNRAILIHGFWRSGTTYFMEYMERLLNRRAFFEPLHFSVEQARPFHTGMGFTINGDEVKQGYPFTLPDAKYSEHDIFYEAMFRGQVSTPWTRWNRKPNHYLKKDVIVKSVRANFIAPYLMNRFGTKNIFIVRHPAGVLASIIRKKSGAYTIYKSVSSEKFLNLLLAEIKKNDPEKLSKKVANAVEHYRGNAINNIILTWCLCNYIPLQYIEEGSYKPLLINYESFFLDSVTKNKLYNYLSVDRSLREMNFNSSTTKKSRKNISIQQRLYSWQQDLTEQQIKRVYKISSLFGNKIENIVNIAEQYKF